MTINTKNPSSPPKLTKAYSNKGTKYHIILGHLRLGGSINKFEALILGEACLGTTIGAMCGDFDLEVIRVFEKAKNTIGTYSRVIRYKLNAVKLRGSDE
jgi:hypothetical protein